MASFKFDHVHLRTPDPEATAGFYEQMFGAKVLRSEQNGMPRVDMDLCGQMFFLAKVKEGEIDPAPKTPHMGLEHVGLTVNDIDTVVADLKAKGAQFTMEPKTIRPGVRIAFMEGPENVSIELVDRNAA